VLLLSTLSLAACFTAAPEYYPPRPAVLSPPPPAYPAAPGVPARPAGTADKAAILLPLTGTHPELAEAMLKAARLALDTPGAPVLDVKDTAGTPEGAAAAAQQAIAAGDRIMLGPLTAAETAAVAGPARAAGIPVLAFTSDPAQAKPGVWALGLTPAQQVLRLVGAAQAKGKTRFGALLPDNEFGHLMAEALDAAAAATPAATPPTVRQYAPEMASMNQAVREIADYADRRGPIDARLRAARERNDAEGHQQAADLAHAPVPPPPFDALLLAASGQHLAELGSLLPYYDVEPREVQILGPALWAERAARAGAGKVLEGAWYAAPDPASRAPFTAQYGAKYGAPPPSLADFAYDAAAIARVLAPRGGYSVDALTRPQGFAGVEGVFRLLPDGQVRRSLAVFEIRHGEPAVIEPAPQSLAGPAT